MHEPVHQKRDPADFAELACGFDTGDFGAVVFVARPGRVIRVDAGFSFPRRDASRRGFIWPRIQPRNFFRIDGTANRASQSLADKNLHSIFRRIFNFRRLFYQFGIRFPVGFANFRLECQSQDSHR